MQVFVVLKVIIKNYFVQKLYKKFFIGSHGMIPKGPVVRTTLGAK